MTHFCLESPELERGRYCGIEMDRSFSWSRLVSPRNTPLRNLIQQRYTRMIYKYKYFNITLNDTSQVVFKSIF